MSSCFMTPSCSKKSPPVRRRPPTIHFLLKPQRFVDTGQICGARALAPRPSSDLDPFCGAPRCSADPRLGRKPQQWWGGRAGARASGVTFRSSRPEGAESVFFEEGGDFAQSPIWQGGAQFSEKYPVRVVAPKRGCFLIFFDGSGPRVQTAGRAGSRRLAGWQGPDGWPRLTRRLGGTILSLPNHQVDKLTRSSRVSKSTASGPPVTGRASVAIRL
jgi:hypothetical protein